MPLRRIFTLSKFIILVWRYSAYIFLFCVFSRCIFLISLSSILSEMIVFFQLYLFPLYKHDVSFFQLNCNRDGITVVSAHASCNCVVQLLCPTALCNCFVQLFRIVFTERACFENQSKFQMQPEASCRCYLKQVATASDTT